MTPTNILNTLIYMLLVTTPTTALVNN